MNTNFKTNYPQEYYTATVEITGTREELTLLHDLLKKVEPSSERERRIKDDVIFELRYAYGYLVELEEI